MKRQIDQEENNEVNDFDGEKTFEPKVLSFPLRKMIRQKSFKSSQERKAALGLSILSIVIFTVAFNQWINDLQVAGPSSQRSLASVKMNYKQMLLQEHELAKKLATKDNEMEGHKAEPISLKDELVFSLLEGKYELKTQNNSIKSLVLQGTDAVILKEKEFFIQKYLSLFNKNAVQFKVKQQSTLGVVYELIDRKGLVVDQLSMSLDSSGNLKGIEIL